MKQLIIAVLFFVVPSLGLANPVLAPGSQQSLTKMLKKAMPAVVNIYGEGNEKPSHSPFSKSHRRRTHNGHFVSIGSGVIVNAKLGYILTNAHVIFNADNITVTLNDGRRFKAKTIGSNTNFDIAVLKIEAKNLSAIPLGDSSALQVGDFVTAIGSPFNLKQTVTSGIVSALHRSIHIEGNEDFIQTDAAINVGSSGGALVNMKGQLVGINTAILAPDGGNIGIGFAIPIKLAHHVMNSILRYGKLKRGLLGVLVQNLTPDLAANFDSPNVKGALIAQVNPHTPAFKAGLRAGDIIVAVNGQTIESSNEVRNIISLMNPNTNVSLDIIHQTKKKTIRTRILGMKELNALIDANNKSLLSGVSLSNFNQITLHHGHVKGVLAMYINRSSNAWASKLRPGDIIVSANHHSTKNIEQLEAVVKKSNQHLLLHVLQGPGSFYLVIP